MQLTIEDFQLLALLDSNPDMTYTELSDVLSLSPYKVKKRLDLLKEWNILRPPIARYDPHPLNLERINILAQVSTIKALHNLEIACDVHPYTHYRSRFYGEGFGLFMQYDIPTGTLPKLMSWFKHLRNLIEFRLLSTDQSTNIRIETYPKLDQWIFNSFRWEFDWGPWRTAFREIAPSPIKISPRTIILKEIDKIDLQLLSELNTNAKQPLSVLSRKTGRSKADLSRRINFLKKHVIHNLRIQYDRKIFDLTNVKLIQIPRLPENEKTVRQLCHSLQEHPIPFRLALNLGKEHAWLWIVFPPYHEAEFAYTLFEAFKGVKVFTIDVIGKHGILYPLYPENYDDITREWKSDEDWMMHHPLEQLEEKLASKNLIR